MDGSYGSYDLDYEGYVIGNHNYDPIYDEYSRLPNHAWHSQQLEEIQKKKIKIPSCSPLYILMYHDHDVWFIEFENLLRAKDIDPKYWFTILYSRMSDGAIRHMYSDAPLSLIGHYEPLRDWICSNFGPRAPFYDIETDLRALPRAKFNNSVELFKEVDKLRCRYTRLCSRQHYLPNTINSQMLIAVLIDCLPRDCEIQREKLLELLSARVSYFEYRIQIESLFETSFDRTNEKRCSYCDQSGHFKNECPVRQYHRSKSLVLVKEDDVIQTVCKYRQNYFFNNNDSIRGINNFRPKGKVRFYNRKRKFGNIRRSYVGDTGILKYSDEEDIDEGSDYINFEEIMIDESGNKYSIEQLDGVEFMPVF